MAGNWARIGLPPGCRSGGPAGREGLRAVGAGPERRLRVRQRDPGALVVPEGEAVAGGLGLRLPAQPLLDVPVQPLMAVEEPEHLPGPGEGHPRGEPDEPDAAGPGAAGGVVDDLAEGQEGIRQLKRDPVGVELGPSRQMGLAAVPERVHEEVVSVGPGQASEHPTDLGRGEGRDVGGDLQGRGTSKINARRPAPPAHREGGAPPGGAPSRSSKEGYFSSSQTTLLTMLRVALNSVLKSFWVLLRRRAK